MAGRGEADCKMTLDRISYWIVSLMQRRVCWACVWSPLHVHMVWLWQNTAIHQPWSDSQYSPLPPYWTRQNLADFFSCSQRGFSHGHSPAIICIRIPVISDGGGGEESSSEGWRFFSWEPMQIFSLRLQKTRKGGMLAKVQKQFYKKAKLRWSRDFYKCLYVSLTFTCTFTFM